MKRITLLVVLAISIMLGGCGEKSILDSMTDASTIETLEACFTCAKGVQDKAEGQAAVDEFAELLKDIKVPESD